MRGDPEQIVTEPGWRAAHGGRQSRVFNRCVYLNWQGLPPQSRTLRRLQPFSTRPFSDRSRSARPLNAGFESGCDGALALSAHGDGFCAVSDRLAHGPFGTAAVAVANHHENLAMGVDIGLGYGTGDLGL